MEIKRFMKKRIKCRGVKYCGDCDKFPCGRILDEQGAMIASGCIVEENDEIVEVTTEAYVSALRKLLSYDTKPSEWVMNDMTLYMTMKLPELLATENGYYMLGIPINIDNEMKYGEVILR